MNDQEKSRQRDHWQAIADQLGLSTDVPSGGDYASRSTEPPRSPAAEPPARVSPPQVEVSEPANPDTIDEPAADDSRVVEEMPTSDRPEEGDNRGGGRRGRRRGRGRGGRRPDESQGGDASSPPKEGTRETESEDRGRRQSRRRPADPNPAPATAVEDANAAPAMVADEEDSEDLSTWTVPSWNELIASLYRPER